METTPAQGTEARQVIVAGQQHYEILRAIGAGGMGQVLLVRSPQHPDPIALKMLPAGLMADNRITAFKREFSLLSELHHPHVCRVYDFGYSAARSTYFFTAEFVEGVDLFRAMLQAPQDEIERVIAQILSALDFIHTVGLIHFDIKGDNILVSRKNGQLHATVVDFGITNPADQPLKEIAGTLYYMAPELFQPNPQVDSRVDLYAFGVVCYRLLASVYPYEVNSVAEARAWHATQRLDLEPLRARGTPEYLCHLVQRLMAPNPADRFSSAAVVLNYLSLHSGRTFHELPTLQRANLIEGPLVDREGPLATLNNAVHRVVGYMAIDETIDQEEHPQAYLVAGSRGMGKSRLLKEVKYTAQLEDCATFLVDAEQEGQNLTTFLTAMGHAVADQPPTPDAAAEAVLQAAHDRSTCYLIDNFDRATPIVQKMIRAMLGVLYSATLAHSAPPVLVIVTYTTGSTTIPKSSGAPVVELTPLSKEQVATYVTQLLGGSDDLTAFIDAVWDFSQGVPFLMTEATRRYHQEPGALPASIEDLYTQQLTRLDAVALQALQCLAYAKRPLSMPTLQQLCPACDAAMLQQLQNDGLVRATSAEQAVVTTATGALAQAVERMLTPGERHAFADRLVAHLSTQLNLRALDMAPYLGDLSDHHHAVTLLRQAADEAEKGGEGARAVGLLEQRVALLAQMPDQMAECQQSQRKMATLLLYQGKYAACETLLQQMLDAQPNDVEALKLFGLVKRAQRKPREAGEFYQRALQQLAEDPGDPTFLFLSNERAQALLEEGVPQDALEIYQKTHTWTKALPPDKRRKVVNNNLGVVLARLGRTEEAVTFYQEKLAMFQAERRIAASINGQLGVIHLHAGRTSEALAAFEQAWTISSDMGDQHNALALLENIIALLQKQSRYSEALVYAQRSFQIKAAGAPDVDLSRSLMTVATLYLNLGLPDLAARYLTQAMRLARRHRSYQLIGWIQITFGYLYKDLGRLMESLNAFEETIAIGENNTDEDLIRWGCYGAVDLLVESGEIEEATTFLQQLTPLAPNTTDEEFKVRHHILVRKIDVIKQAQPDAAIGPELAAISAQCEAQGWREFQWEVEYLLGVYHEKRDEEAQALVHLQKAFDIITTIATGLGEEYRQNYTQQRSRAKVRADYMSLQQFSGRGTGGTKAPTSGADPVTAPGNVTAPRVVPAAGSVTAVQPQRLPESADVIYDPGITLAAYEKELIRQALEHFRGDLELTAGALKIELAVLMEKIKRYQIDN